MKTWLLLMCGCVSKNEAVFLSDSISALSVLKEVISREATQKKARISIKAGTLPVQMVQFSDLCTQT